MKPLTVAEWDFIRQLLAGVSRGPDGVDVVHLRAVVADNRRSAEQRADLNARFHA